MSISDETRPESRSVGRPSEYRPEFCQKAASLCVNGATDFEVAEELGVNVRTLYRWKAEFPDFRQALKVGKELADERVKFSLYHRAVGYSHQAVKIFMPAGAEGPVYADYIEHVAPDPSAAKLWLTNRMPDEWREKVVQEVTGKDGGPIEIDNARERNLALLEAVASRVAGQHAAAAEAGSAEPAEPGGDA